MKKFIRVFAILVACFLFSSFNANGLYPWNSSEAVNHLPDKNSQKLYSIIDVIDSYSAICTFEASPIIEKLACVLASNMIVDLDEVAQSLTADSKELTIKVYLMNIDKITLINDTEFEFATYSTYFPQLSRRAMEQIYKLALDETLYTKEYEIQVTFADEFDSYLLQSASLSHEDLASILDECLLAANRIYANYIASSDITNAFFCKSIKELPMDNVVDIYNANNEENPIIDDISKTLFLDYSRHYIDSLVIQNITKINTAGTKPLATISYQIEDGDTTIDKVCNQLLSSYYIATQPPIDKEQVALDFGSELGKYTYSDNANFLSKTFDFSYSQSLNEFTLDEDFYSELVNHIYDEFIKFEEIFNNYYPTIESDYFFIERPYTETTVISDTTGDSRYRQIDIKVTGATDCYIKLYSYDAVTDRLTEQVFAAYIKKGETLQIFIPEGEYIFKYATGEMWYGNLHMFSDTGQYFASSDVLSVHEYMMTTIIELGNFADGSIPTYSQTPDLF